MLTMEDVRPIPRHLIPLSRCLVFTMAEVTLWPLTVHQFFAKNKKTKVGSFVHSCREMRSNSRHRNAIRETDVRVPDDFEYILTKYIYIPKQLQIKLVTRLCICGFHCAFMSCPDPPTEQNIGATQHKVPNGVKRISLHQCTNPSNAVAEEGLKLRYGEVCNIDMNGNNVWRIIIRFTKA
jgi:hypothetical protein